MEPKYCIYCMKDSDSDICPYCGKSHATYQTAPHHLQPGTMLNNRYLIGSVLGEGGFGITYIGRDTYLDIRVAIKEYFPAGIVNRNNTASSEITANIGNSQAFFEKGKANFLTEARTLAKFSSETSIVTVRDFFSANNTAYIVMEYLEGIDLKDYLESHGKMSFNEAYSMLRPVLTALNKIHASGLIHRDISPANIMILESGNVKLLDFGAARNVGGADEKSLSVLLKPGYAPEEQYRTKGKQGPWTDVYALSATLYKMLTGVTPEDAMNRMFSDELQSITELNPSVTAKQAAVVLKGMSIRQEDRYQTVAELQAACEEVFSVPVITKEPVTVGKFDVLIAISAGVSHTIGLKQSGTVVAAGWNGEGQCDVKDWIDIIAVSAGGGHTVGLKENGTVVAVGGNDKQYDYGQCDVKNWTDIIAIATGWDHTVGLKKDGTVMAVGRNDCGQCNVKDWTDIIAISAGDAHTVGLRSNGTVIAAGWNGEGQCDAVNGWTDIIAVSVGYAHIVGLKKDGTVVAAGWNGEGQCDVRDWTDIVEITAGGRHTAGRKADGTVVAVSGNGNRNDYGQCAVEGWTNIAAISAGAGYTVGLKKDGTVVAAGRNDYGQCNVSNW